MIKLSNPSMVPSGGGFVVAHPVTGQEFKHQNITVLYRDYRKYCSDNGMSIPAPTEIEQMICQQHPEWCIDGATKMPPLAAQVRNVIKEVAGWVVSGMPVATREMVEKRLTICNACEYWSGGRCQQCGCSLQLKVHLESAHCPLPTPKW